MWTRSKYFLFKMLSRGVSQDEIMRLNEEILKKFSFPFLRETHTLCLGVTRAQQIETT